MTPLGIFGLLLSCHTLCFKLLFMSGQSLFSLLQLTLNPLPVLLHVPPTEIQIKVKENPTQPRISAAMPSSSALWASMTPVTTSPMA